MKQTIGYFFIFCSGILIQKKPLLHSDYDWWKSILELETTYMGYWTVFENCSPFDKNSMICTRIVLQKS